MSLFPKTIILKHGFKKLRSKKIVSCSRSVEQLEKREMFAGLPPAELQWTSYTSQTASDIWVVKSTEKNGFGVNNDSLLMVTDGTVTDGLVPNGNRIGMQQNLGAYNFFDPSNLTVGANTNQHQVSDDGTALYVGGTTPHGEDLNISSLSGFDTTQNYGTTTSDPNARIASYDQRRALIGAWAGGQETTDQRSESYRPRTTPIENGIFSHFILESTSSSTLYTTFVGGDSEGNLRGLSDQTYAPDSGGNIPRFGRGLTEAWRQGSSYLNSFYVDTSKSGDEIFLGGTTNARVGITDRTMNAYPTESSKKLPTSYIDYYRDKIQGGIDYDGMIYSINDARHEPTSGKLGGQLNWATYLSPQKPNTDSTPDSDPFIDNPLLPFKGRVDNINFMWSAKSASGDKMLFLIGDRYPNQQSSYLNPNNIPEPTLVTMNLTKIMDPAISRLEKYTTWTSFERFGVYKPEGVLERIIVPNAMLGDLSGKKGPAMLIRYIDKIVKIDLPRDGQWISNKQGQSPKDSSYAWANWTADFSAATGNTGDFSPLAMSVSPNGERFYVADSVSNFSWGRLPFPTLEFGGKKRSGPSDAALVEFNMINPSPNWMMLQGGAGSEIVSGLAALSNGEVYVIGSTTSTASLPNPNGFLPWIPNDVANLVGNKMVAPIPINSDGPYGPLGMTLNPIEDGTKVGFIFSIQTSNRTLSTAEIDVGGIVSNLYVPILDGASIASAAQGTDFGRTWNGSPTQERTFEIKNTGTDPLGIAGIDIPSWLELKDPAPVVVVAGGKVQFTLLVKKGLSVVANLSGTVTIRNTDADEGSYDFKVAGAFILPPLPTFKIAASSVSALEGKIGTTPVTFVVSFLQGIPASVFPASIGYTVVGVSATSGTDYTASSANSFLTFNAGQTSQTVTVNVIGDSFAEKDEVFEVRLQNPSTGSVVSTDAPSARFTILNDDGVVGPATVAFSPIAIRVTEGNSGSRKATLMVTLSKPISGPVTVQYGTASGTAASGSDFTNSIGTITFPTGSTRQSIDIPIIGDTISEADEVLNVRLMNVQTTAVDGASLSSSASVASITIVNDDGVAPPPRVTVSNPTVIEGNSGSPKLSFAITLAQAASSNVVLKYQTANGTAVAGRDYTTASNTITILAGRTTAVVTINVLPNTKVDGDRTVRLNILYNNSQVAQGIGTIRDDDRRLTTVASLSSQVAMAAAFSDLGSVSGTTSTLKTNSKRIL